MRFMQRTKASVVARLSRPHPRPHPHSHPPRQNSSRIQPRNRVVRQSNLRGCCSRDVRRGFIHPGASKQIPEAGFGRVSLHPLNQGLSGETGRGSVAPSGGCTGKTRSRVRTPFPRFPVVLSRCGENVKVEWNQVIGMVCVRVPLPDFVCVSVCARYIFSSGA